MSQKQVTLKEAIKEEYKKCLVDPIYFMKKYVKIQHPVKGTVNFDLYPFQEETLQSFVSNNRNIILKSRQMGISTLVAAYSLWLMVFHNDKKVLCLSITQDTAKEIVTRVRFANEKLPSWLRLQEEENNRLSLKLSNKSEIKAVSSAGNAARGSANSLLILDECAFIEGIDEIWTSAQLTLATGGQVIMLSTPNGVSNFFHKMWMDAEAKRNDFKTIKLPWHLHPERDQAWRDKQTELNGPKKSAQELDCDFQTSGNTVIDLILLETYKTSHVKEPLEIRGTDKGLWIWEVPNYSKQYIISADVSRGDSTDYSTCHVIELETMTQVAEYQGLIDTKEFGNLLVGLATEYNDALLVIENANIGWATIQQVIDRGYKNLFYSSTDLKYVDVLHQATNKHYKEDKKLVPGFTTTAKTRPLMISRLEMYIRDGLVDVKSIRTINELSTFIWNGPKAEAMSGHNDDLIMALAIGIWIRDTALRLKLQSQDLNKVMLDSVKKIESDVSQNAVYTPHSLTKATESWTLNVGHPNAVGNKKESLLWLL